MYCDILCLQDKAHTAHIRTVNMLRCKTLHAAFGEVYTSLQDILDSFGENIIMKLEKWMVPTAGEAYNESSIEDLQSEDRQEMLNEIYDDVEDMEECFGECLEEADNKVAQIIGPHREKLTDLCALLEREMYALPKDEEE